MNDLDICKRIAEIEVLPNLTQEGIVIVDFTDRIETTHWEEYNPITNDALCFRLMVKYDICFSKGDLGGKYIAKKRRTEKIESHSNPNKAICLAIIEAHNE